MMPIKALHQVAIGGRVLDAGSGRVLPGARVTVKGKAIDGMRETKSSIKGVYYFLDLPNGTYEVEVSIPGSGTRRGSARKRVKVARDGDDRVESPIVDLKLGATTVHGRVESDGGDPIPMARE